MPETLSSESEERPLQKVVVRLKDGEVLAGFAARDEIREDFRILDRRGKPKNFQLKEVKALFFVKDFQGDPEYQEIRFLNRKQGSDAVWVRIRFGDGETLEGRVENNLHLVAAPGFFLWPSDSETNNECAYIPKEALVEFSILTAD